MNFQQPYNRQAWIEFLDRDFLPEDFRVFTEDIPLEFEHEHIEKITKIGLVPLLDLPLYEVQHESENDPRVSLSKGAFRLLAGFGQKRALILFISGRKKNYRFSLITIDLKLEGKKVKKEYSNPRRYSFFLGPDAKIHTPQQYLEQKGRIKDFDDLQKRFSIEVVTKDFYRDYASVFNDMEEAISKNNTLEGDNLRMFTQMLFNRLMFLRFIERKGWLKFGNTSDYLSNLYAAGSIGQKSFYQSRLMPLFFSGLAIEGEQVSEAIGRVPFLNGGLFEKIYLDEQVQDIPDDTFKDILGPDGLFYKYNFTVEESTPLDIEVAVDPEMLGKVFEELVTGRHETGSYYTPRPVVAFMCREAIKGYLCDKTSVSKKAIELLVDEHTITRDSITDQQAGEILFCIRMLKACDPACGSGAYLLGLMQELISIRQTLRNQAIKQDAQSLYDLKLKIISENLYGVDIDPFATNIAKLRLWLSLSVEAESPVALPNLDFKIETGDSLLGHCEGQAQKSFGMFALENAAKELAQKKHEYLTAHGQRKEHLIKWIHDRQTYLANELQEVFGPNIITWPVHFAEVFFADPKKQEITFKSEFSFMADIFEQKAFKLTIGTKTGGFDIVLANPPYVRQELITNIKPQLKDNFPEVYAGTADLYVYFYARAIQMLREGGVLSFIAPNKFFRAQYGKYLRSHLLAKSQVLDLLDFGDYPIFQAITYPSIIIAQKKATPDKEQTIRAYNWKSDDSLNEIASFISQKSQRMEQKSLSSEAWRIMDGHVSKLLCKLRVVGNCLGDLLSNKFYRGIVTGCNEVFEIDENTRRTLIQQDPHSSEIIRPWLRGRNIERWTIKWDNKYLLFTRRGIDIDRYPAVKKYLKSHREMLEPKPSHVATKGWKGRKPGSYKWYEIQDAIDYWKEFDKPKIIYQVIATYQQFAYTTQPFVANDKTWIIPEPLDGLLGLLNSKVCWFFLDQIVAKLQGGAFELRSPYISQIPVPKLSSDLKKKTKTIWELASTDESDTNAIMALEKEIDDIIVSLYGLTKAEEKIIDEAIEAAGNRFPRQFRQTKVYRDYVDELFGDE